MIFPDAMEIILALAEENALDENDPEVKDNPALLEAAQAQKAAIAKVRKFHEDTIKEVEETFGPSSGTERQENH